MTLPVDVGMLTNELPPVVTLSAEDSIEALLKSVEPNIYAQIAERRSQLEDAETLRRVRAL
jgi:hypothetical protein